MRLFYGKNWTDLGDGRLLYGSLDGLGSVVFDDKRIISGQLKNGVLDGYGFAFVIKEWDETITRKRTYEEVMETAEFDSCGRVIWCDGSPITYTKHHEDWPNAGTGLWKDGELVKSAEMVFPGGITLKAQWKEYTFGKMNHEYMEEELPFEEITPEGYVSAGWYQMYVQPMPDGRILCVNDYTIPFILAPGEKFVYDHDKNDICYNSYIYSLAKKPKL